MVKEEPAGSLNRAVVILKTLASTGESGMALTHISQRCGLPHSSVHRVLQQLRAAQLVCQTAPDGRYALGPLAFELGVAAAQQFDIRGRSREAVTSLANEMGDTAYLFLRSGSEAVCLDRVFGPAPVRVVTLRIGSRRPLGLGAGGLAILAFLNETQREAAINDVAPILAAERGIDEAELRQMVADSRERGYAYIEGQLTPDVYAVGKPILNSFKQPIGGLSIAAPAARMPPARIPKVAQALESAASRIELSLFSAEAALATHTSVATAD
ncbi:IclR family transcriptional regulator [Streptomyces sp. NPDC047061]|uniref:IclR family transcriptional regulator n=1 Tax=Streptomyces sp. NPDC047061 TaxID=3154605 RepID=UPI0034057656